jgi:hypothetical protein
MVTRLSRIWNRKFSWKGNLKSSPEEEKIHALLICTFDISG